MGFTAAGNFFAYSFLLGMTLLVFHSDRKLLAYSFLPGIDTIVFHVPLLPPEIGLLPRGLCFSILESSIV